jgi:hypothetical protein
MYQPGASQPLNRQKVAKGGFNMNRIHPIRRLVATLAGLAVTLVAAVAGGTAAFATVAPPPGPLYARFGPIDPAVPAHAHAAVTEGMAGWQIALIALGAAILGAIVAVLLDRARAARRHQPAMAS